MTPADVLWLDSSVIHLGGRKLDELAKLAKSKGVKVVVHAHIHLETCRRLRESKRAKGEAYSQSHVTTSLDQLGIAIADVTFDRATAEAWAESLGRRYPTSADWKRAKADSVRARLPAGATVPASEVPMTTDWLVALEIERRGDVVAVEDKGEEWQILRSADPCRAFTYDAAMTWLGARP